MLGGLNEITYVGHLASPGICQQQMVAVEWAEERASVITLCAGDYLREGGWRPLPFPLGEPSSTHHMLNRMCVEGDHTDGSCPLVVFLVDFLVEFWVVKEAGKRVNS